MIGNKLYGQGIVCAVIFLFIGAAVFPGISGNDGGDMKDCDIPNIEDDNTAWVEWLCCPPQDCDIEVTKEVKENCDGIWSHNGIIIDLCDPDSDDWVTFRINVTNTGDVPLDVTVKDVLPDGLIYANNARVNGIPHEPDYHVGQVLKWYFDGVPGHSGDPLVPDEKVVITFKAEMGQCDELYENYVNVSGDDGCGGCDLVYDDSTAWVEWLCCPPQDCDIEVTKEVKENCDGIWSHNGIIIDLCDPDSDDWVTFRINVTNTGDVPLDVTVKDVLPDGLIYANNARVNGIPHEPDYHVGQVLKWYFDGVPGHSGDPLVPDEKVVITFKAEMGQCDELYENYVNVSGDDGCGGCDLVYDDNTAWVEWLCCPPQDCDIEVTKEVKENCDGIWSHNGIIIDLCDPDSDDWVTFRINVTNTGDVPLDVTVKDVLPDGLIYAYNARVNGIPHEPDYHVGQVLKWYFDGVPGHSGDPLVPDEKVVITFKAEMGQCDELYENYVNVSGDDGCGGCDLVYDDNTAWVEWLCCPPQDCDIEVTKEVKENCDGIWSHNGIIIDLCDPDSDDWVTFRINVTNTGDVPLDVTVKDVLPDGLIYAYNARVNGIPHEPDYHVGQVLKWYFDGVPGHSGDPLVPDEKVVITFKAEMGQCDELYENYVNVSGDDGCGGCDLVYDDNTAWVEWLCCDGPPHITVEKLVKPDCSDNSYWGTDITFDINDHSYSFFGVPYVAYKLTVVIGSYFDSAAGIHEDCFDRVDVYDQLPEGLTFLNCVSPINFERDGGTLHWWIEYDCTYSDIDNDEYVIYYWAGFDECGSYTNDVTVYGDDVLCDSTNATFTVTGCGCEDDNPIDADAGGPYEGDVGESIMFTGSASGGTPPYTYNWDLDNDGQYDDATGSTASKSWSSEGTHTIGIEVIDDNSNTDTDIANVDICRPNNAPDTPDISGDTMFNVEDVCTFSAVTTDPDNDEVRYLFDWGDGSDSGWLGLYDSGDTCTSGHFWVESGTYEVKVKAKDEKGAESSFSPILSVYINCPPDIPSNPNPEQDKTGVNIDTIFGWTGSDPDSEVLTYDVYFGTTGSPQKIISNQSATIFNPEKLQSGTTYYWKVVAWDEYDASAGGQTWSFTTKEDDTSPVVEIIKPEKALYLSNIKIRSYLIHKSLIIGKINITVDATDFESGIERVEFYIDGELKSADTNEPYCWTWQRGEFIRHRHTIEIVVYDRAGNQDSSEMTVWKFL